eukprot:4134942-Prymnesium_polylepis.2
MAHPRAVPPACGPAKLEKDRVGISPHRTEQARLLRLRRRGIGGRVVQPVAGVREGRVDPVESAKGEAALPGMHPELARVGALFQPARAVVARAAHVRLQLALAAAAHADRRSDDAERDGQTALEPRPERHRVRRRVEHLQRRLELRRPQQEVAALDARFVHEKHRLLHGTC